MHRDRDGGRSMTMSLLLYAAPGAALLLGAFAAASAAAGAYPTGHGPGQIRVAIVAKGDVGNYAGMCGSPAGTDSLDGYLDLQDLADDGSALYSGKFVRVTDVVACGTKPAPTEDQVAMCSATLSGRADMDVTVELYEDNRGVWVKSEPVRTFKKEIHGCPEPGEYLRVYPEDGWMSGLAVEGVPSFGLVRGTWTTGNVTLIVY